MTDLIGFPLYVLASFLFSLYIYRRIVAAIAKPPFRFFLSYMLAAQIIAGGITALSYVTGWLSGRITFP